MVYTCNPSPEKEGRHWQIPGPHLVNCRPVRDLVSEIKVEDIRYLSSGLHTYIQHMHMRLHICEHKHTQTCKCMS